MHLPRALILVLVCCGIAASPSSANDTTAFVQDVEPAAWEAVKVVDEFSAAIRTVRIAAAAALLDPGVLVLESGGSERSRDQYLDEHAQADAEYMKQTQQQLRYRQARSVGGIAWVATESIVRHDKDGKSTSSFSTETMLLKKTAHGWKIVHIHWSSRPAPAGK